MRKYVSSLLARRAPEPPGGFMPLQVSRLNEALFVSYGANVGANLEAMGRAVTIVRELDRHHAFTGRPKPSHLALPSGSERRFWLTGSLPSAVEG